MESRGWPELKLLNLLEIPFSQTKKRKIPKLALDNQISIFNLNEAILNNLTEPLSLAVIMDKRKF